MYSVNRNFEGCNSGDILELEKNDVTIDITTRLLYYYECKM